MNVAAALHHRISANNFDSSAALSDAEVTELAALAGLAPSSFNIQHVRFVAVTDPELKAKLKAVAYNQAKVGDAAAVFVLFGDMSAHIAFAERLKGAVAAGFMDQGTADYMTNMSGNFYSNPVAAREEAVRSAGLAGMALMLAAEEKGYGSAPMIGFDPAGVSQVLGVPARYFPAIMIAVGPLAAGNMAQKPRLSTADTLRINGGSFPA